MAVDDDVVDEADASPTVETVLMFEFVGVEFVVVGAIATGVLDTAVADAPLVNKLAHEGVDGAVDCVVAEAGGAKLMGGVATSVFVALAVGVLMAGELFCCCCCPTLCFLLPEI